MNCKLCGILIDSANKCEAHILPRGLLKLLSEDEYGNLLIVGTDFDKKRRSPIGSYDSNILCANCDNRIGKYDDYCIKFVTDSKLIDHPSGLGWTISGVDQKMLKLFCVSYLWRASITSRSEFSGVSLGQQHENKMRELINTNSTGTPNDYTVIFSKFGTGKDVGGIMFPAKTRINGMVYYEAYLPGLYKFWVKVDSRDDKVMSRLSLESNSVVFVHNRGDFDSSIEKSIMVRAAKASN
jgi:hypothetical protein